MATVRELPTPNAERFALVPFSKMALSRAQPYLVKGLIPPDAMIIVWGEPKCGKSFFAFDLGFHIAAGIEYRGRKVSQGTVVYCALEGAAGYGKRVEAIRRHRAVSSGRSIPLYVMTVPLDLVSDQDALVAAVRRQITGDVACVFIDTLNRSLRGSESSDEDIAAYIRASDSLRTALGCAVIIVHHCGYNDSRMRGHSSLIGALDAELSVKKGGDGKFTVKVERAKDDKEGDTIISQLRVVDLGADSEGDTITSCVVEPAEEDMAERAATARKLSDRQRVAIDALQSLIASSGKPVPATFALPASVNAVQVVSWRDELFRRGTLDAKAKNPRADFIRLKDALHARHITAERDNLIWLT